MDSKNILSTYHIFTTYHIFATKIRRPIFFNFSGRGQPLFSNFHSMGPPIIKKDAAVPGGDVNISGTALKRNFSCFFFFFFFFFMVNVLIIGTLIVSMI